MLFIDNEKFTLQQEDLDQLRMAFPDFINKNHPVSVAYVDSKVSKLQTNNPTMPWVSSKPTIGILLVYNWIDEETGNEREIRYTEKAPKYLADGRKEFTMKNLVIDSSFKFTAERHKELLWFCYNFGTSFENSLADIKNPVLKFMMPEKEAKQKANSIFKDAKIKSSVGSLNRVKLIELCKSVGIPIDPTQTSKDIILSTVYQSIDNSESIRIKLEKMFFNSVDEDILSLLEKAWNLDVITPSLDGEKTVIIVDEKEVVLAELPIDDLEVIAEFLSKDKKALSLLEKAMS